MAGMTKCAIRRVHTEQVYDGAENYAVGHQEGPPQAVQHTALHGRIHIVAALQVAGTQVIGYTFGRTIKDMPIFEYLNDMGWS